MQQNLVVTDFQLSIEIQQLLEAGFWLQKDF